MRVPSLAVSGYEAEPFFRIDRIVPVPGGGFVIASRSNPPLKILDDGGRALRRLGRLGRGPGEFIGINGLQILAPDTLIVFDAAARRLTTYTLSGDLVDVVELGQTASPFFSGYTLLSATRNALIFVPDAVPVLPREGSGLIMESLPILVFNRAGIYLAELGPKWRLELYSDSRRAAPRPFGFRTSVAVHGELVYVTVPEGPRVEVWTAGGQRTGAVEWNSEDRKLDKGTRAVFIANYAASVPAGRRKEAVAWLRAIPFPAAVPHQGRIILSEDGQIFIEVPNRDVRARHQQWLVFDSAGQSVGGYRLPLRFRLHSVTRTAFVGVWLDNAGAEHLHQYTRAALLTSNIAQE
jgi:hypothetical protein